MSSFGCSTAWYGGNYKVCQPLEQMTEQHARCQPGAGQFTRSQSEPPLLFPNHMSRLSSFNPRQVEPHSGDGLFNYSDSTSPHIWLQRSSSDSVIHFCGVSSRDGPCASTPPAGDLAVLRHVRRFSDTFPDVDVPNYPLCTSYFP